MKLSDNAPMPVSLLCSLLRSGKVPDTVCRAAAYALERLQRQVDYYEVPKQEISRLRGMGVNLGLNERIIFSELVRNAGKIVTLDALSTVLNAEKLDGSPVTAGSTRVTIHKLRRKLAPLEIGMYIQTVQRRQTDSGWRLVRRVRVGAPTVKGDADQASPHPT